MRLRFDLEKGKIDIRSTFI